MERLRPMSSSDLPLMDLASIHAATDSFSKANKLGEGGFGPVYRGVLPGGGAEIAVKRLSARSRQGAAEFRNEVELIAKLQHRNLVRLLGWCAERDEKLLVYEFLPNGSLDAFLFSTPRPLLLLLLLLLAAPPLLLPRSRLVVSLSPLSLSVTVVGKSSGSELAPSISHRTSN
jgi:serine/threonine protein kinase